MVYFIEDQFLVVIIDYDLDNIYLISFYIGDIKNMKVKDSIRSQLLVMIEKAGFKISFSIVLGYCLICYIINVLHSINVDLSMILSADSLFSLNSNASMWSVFNVIFPYIVILPFSFSYIDDNNSNIHPYFMQRVGKKQYFIGKIIVSFIGGFIIIFVPFAVNLLLHHITFPDNHNTFWGIYNTLGYCNALTGSDVIVSTQQKGLLFLKLYLYNPFLYNLLFLVICSIFSGILSMLSTSFSYICSKNKIVIFLPVFLFFYLGSIADDIFYGSNNYINCNWLDYVSVDLFYGKNIILFLLIILFFLMFIIITTFITCYAKKE